MPCLTPIKVRNFKLTRKQITDLRKSHRVILHQQLIIRILLRSKTFDFQEKIPNGVSKLIQLCDNFHKQYTFALDQN